VAEASGSRTHHRRPKTTTAGFEVEPNCGRERSGSLQAKLRRLCGVRAARRNAEPVERIPSEVEGTRYGGSEWESNPPSPPKDDDRRF